MLRPWKMRKQVSSSCQACDTAMSYILDQDELVLSQRDRVYFVPCKVSPMIAFLTRPAGFSGVSRIQAEGWAVPVLENRWRVVLVNTGVSTSD